MSHKQDNDKATGPGYQHLDSFERNLHRPGAMDGHGDQIVTSIEAPQQGDKNVSGRKSKEDHSLRYRTSDKQGILNDSKDERKVSGYVDTNTTQARKRDASNLDRENSRSPAPQSRREEVNQSRNQTNPSTQPQRSFWQKCPYWLKVLFLLITLIAVGGLLYWCFFKRGKTAPLVKHKREHVINTTKTVVVPATPVSINNTTPVLVTNQTSSETTVKQQHPSDQGLTPAVKETEQAKEKVQNMIKDVAPVVEKQEKTVVVTPSLSSEATDTMVVPKGNRTFCPDTQFLLNGNCMSCPAGMTWSGLNCVVSVTVKHLKRSH